MDQLFITKVKKKKKTLEVIPKSLVQENQHFRNKGNLHSNNFNFKSILTLSPFQTELFRIFNNIFLQRAPINLMSFMVFTLLFTALEPI